jgi:molecular chaperone GrpE
MIVSQDNLEPGTHEPQTGQAESNMPPKGSPFAFQSDISAADSGEATLDETSPSIESLQQQLQESNDRLLRSQAELENYRKRSRRELDEQRRYAQLPIIRDLLPVLDNLERAVSSANQSDDPSIHSLLEGVQLVTAELKSVLERHHCQPTEAVAGTVFDPNCHEAISQQPSAEHPPSSVMHVVQAGYQLRDRVVRPSQVIVASGVPDETDGEMSSDGSHKG